MKTTIIKLTLLGTGTCVLMFQGFSETQRLEMKSERDRIEHSELISNSPIILLAKPLKDFKKTPHFPLPGSAPRSVRIYEFEVIQVMKTIPQTGLRVGSSIRVLDATALHGTPFEESFRIPILIDNRYDTGFDGLERFSKVILFLKPAQHTSLAVSGFFLLSARKSPIAASMLRDVAISISGPGAKEIERALVEGGHFRGELDEVIERFGNALGSWGRKNHVTVKLNDSEILRRTPSPGGWERLTWDRSLELSDPNAQKSERLDADRRRNFIKNTYLKSACLLRSIVEITRRLERDLEHTEAIETLKVTEFHIRSQLEFLGKLEFLKLAFSSD